eukprot:1037914_1
MLKECILTIDTCPCITRVLFIMRFYSIWIDANIAANCHKPDPHSQDYLVISLSEFIHSLEYYSIIQLTNDWHHLRQHHWTNIHSQHNIRNLFKSTIMIQCDDLTKCRTFNRINRDRHKAKHSKLRKQLYFIQNENINDSIEITHQQICDSIHDLIFHAPIIALPSFVSNKNMDQMEELPQHQSLENHKKAVQKLENGANNYYNHSKFVYVTTNVLQPDDLLSSVTAETKTNEPATNEGAGCYAFGLEMMYSDHYKSYAKFKSIKEEVTLHDESKYCLSMWQWEDTVTKAKQYTQCVRGKGIKAVVGNKTFGIQIDDAISMESLISLSLYTNFTDIQRRFSASTRRYDNEMHETDDDLRIKHYRSYFYWGQRLMITITCYGDAMDDRMSFYHGINTELMFADFTAYFNCPTSCTISLAVASLFASDDGIILKLSGRKSIKRRAIFMDVSWFSDYPNEEERLFYGHRNILEIESVLQGCYNYRKYVRAIKVLDMLTDPNIGGFGTKKYAKLTQPAQIQKYLKYVHLMIRHKVDTQDKDLKKVPQYMMDMFTHFCRIQTQISVDSTRMHLLQHDMTDLFLVYEQRGLDTKYYSPHFDILCKLFPNLVFLSLDFGYPDYLQCDRYEFLCRTVAEYLNQCTQNDRKCKLQLVEFKGLMHKNHLEKVDKQRIKKKYHAILSKWNVKIDWPARCINFRINYKKKQIKSEHIYVGNLHESQSDGAHIWCMFVSTEKDKLIPPKTVKQVGYDLNRSDNNIKEIVVKKSPFCLKRKGQKPCKIDVHVLFNKESGRNALHCWHVVDFMHPVSVTDVFFDTKIKKHAINDVHHCDSYTMFDANFP